MSHESSKREIGTKWWRTILIPLGLSLLLFSPCLRAVEVLTYHNDNARTGLNAQETLLTPANVNSNSFHKLFSQPVDGYVYAEPLLMTGLSIPAKGIHDVVFVATEHDSVYAFDADNNAAGNAAPLWQVSFLNPASGVTTVPSSEVDSLDLVPEIGITSTPVIDPASGTIYVEAKTREIVGNGTNYVHRLHALDVTTGAEKSGSPVIIQPSAAGTGAGQTGNQIAFNGLRQMNRPALLLSRGVVYLAYASHGDNGPYHGWLLGYNATTLTPTGVFNTTPNGTEGGIWLSGCGPAADTSGYIYIVPGNGTFAPAQQNYGESFLKMKVSNSLTVADYFTPYNQAALSTADEDLGSGGAMLLPDEAGSAAHPHLLVGADKQGKVYLLDRDNLGKYNAESDSQIVQELTHVIGSGGFCTPAYFNHALYWAGIGDVLKAFTISGGTIETTPASQAATVFKYPGATAVVSANGTNDAIVWAIQSDAFDSGGAAVLHAYNAANLAQELYNSGQSASTDNPGPAVKFSVPTVVNGKVYVGTQNALSVYGLTTSPTSNAGDGLAIITGPAILNAFAYIGGQAVVLPGRTNQFSVMAQNPSGEALNYLWQFGDGTDDSIATVPWTQHVYLTNCGTYNATVLVSAGNASVSSNLTVSVACDLGLVPPHGRMSASLDLARSDRDSLQLEGQLNLGTAAPPAGALLTANIGGVQLMFQLDDKGHGVAGSSSCRLTYHKVAGTKSGIWKLTLKVTQADLHDTWSVYGVDNATHKTPGVSVTMPVVVALENETFAVPCHLNYVATGGKSGRLK